VSQLSRPAIFLLTAGCFLAFFVFGLTDNLKGPTLPFMLEEMNISYGAGANIFFGQYVGFLIATLFTGLLADRYGLKSVILLAGGLLALGAGGYSSVHSAALMAVSLFILGLGLGALELGPNALIVSVHHERKGLFLNLMAVFHGLGSMLAPLAAGLLLSQSVNWRAIYHWELLLILAFFLYFTFLRFPKKESQPHEAIDFKQLPKVAFQPSLIWFYVSIALYVATEVGIAAWLVTFLQDAQGQSVTASSNALTVFFGTIMLGRFVGSFLVQRVGYLRSILFASCAAAACIALGLFGPPNFSLFLPLAGLFLSIIFPTLTAAVSDNHTANVNTILGMLFTCAGVGAVVGPWIIGWASDLFGLLTGFAVNLVFALLLIVSVLVLMKGKQNEPTPA
jgi:fucose permease